MAIVAHAQDAAKASPTLTQTLDWLKEKIPLAAAHYVVETENNPFAAAIIGKTKDVTVRTAPIRFESCTIVFDETEVAVWGNLPNDPITETLRSTVPLGEVSDTKIVKIDTPLAWSKEGDVVKSLPGWIVGLYTNSDVILEETHRDIGNKTKNSAAHSAGIVFRDESVAKRVSEAFKHAADLCRGTQPF
jgi:hypothetical protein